MDQANQYLASTLRQLRQHRGWSLDRTAQETGVSKAMLGQIERGESSPTIATLWKIAGGFHCSLSTFLDTPQGSLSAEIRTIAELRQRPAQDEMLVAPLFPFNIEQGFEWFELSLPPGYERLSEPHECGVTEYVVVLKGSIELFIDQQWVTLETGNALRFAADQPHGYRNRNETQAVFHNLIRYPDKVK
ncbi:helix-turn-helix domain-containing protein [Aestuariirhabdus haliotis]|uniref:helix-turn-helix domain-containing protein n=1 Tax=Aestuariirhabdus haliotis TaxID=2918751 RepID=UPI0020BE06F0|nr:XRE family transcriptional regulator [Aestuariirhabdus haliotis]MCL6420132.1 XRE family transcriptional regulator [Aestuariirhabdus haliotis]